MTRCAISSGPSRATSAAERRRPVGRLRFVRGDAGVAPIVAAAAVAGAAANDLPGALPAEVREERRARVMLLQEEISLKRLQAKVEALCAKAAGDERDSCKGLLAAKVS